MVMMEKPSPIQVGREFVRQYYTLLNKAPALLHRFYSIESSYIHGGKYCEGEPEEPVIGQNEIHQKIDSLNFRDCHTKIRQVDAHSTIGNGVVVQVTGELSNSGQPLRRFMQTFVLAPQGENPYKFYVHNDIFRYQDEVFSDPAENTDEEEVVHEDNEPVTAEVNQSETMDDNAYYQESAPENIADSQPVLTNGISEQSQEAAMDQDNDAPSPTLEEHVEQGSSLPAASPVPETDNQPEVEAKETDEPAEEQEALEEVETVEPKAQQKPLSWAVMASKNTQNLRSAAPVAPAPAVKQNRPVVEKPEPQEGNDVGRPPRPQKSQRFGARDEERGGMDRPDVRRGYNPGGPGNNQIRYPDNQQIFVGNLPYEISENDLREHFADFGHVLEVRINQSNSNNPNFGFVIFEDPKSVDGVLDVMPTHHKSGHRINIEEKKQRNRDGPRRPGDMRRGGGGMGEGGRGGGRRMPPAMRRDRQGSREGPRPNYSNGPRR